jgi:hypothetical protein
VYPIGLPLLYFFVLYYNKDKIYVKVSNDDVATAQHGDEGEQHELQQPTFRGFSVPVFIVDAFKQVKERTPPAASAFFSDCARKCDDVMQYVTPDVIGFLHEAYEPQFWYWEIVETTRRLFLTAVVSVVAVGSPGQIVFGIFIAVLFVKLYGYFAPYKSDENDFLQEVAQYQVFITLFIALLLQSGTLCRWIIGDIVAAVSIGRL